MSAREARVATTVGEKYRVTRFIAEGGMGAVYEAQHLFVRRRFAIKFLREELARRRDVIARFKHEAQAAGALEHENIAAVVDFGVAGDGTPYLVMEYLEGVDLAALLLSAGQVPAERASDLVAQAALGAHAAHAAGVVHRDLKPQNLFVCRRNDGTDLVKLLDFGIAKLQAADAREAVTRTGAVLGTPAYMSPEQARGETKLDLRTDVYSLGVILYELVSGRLPHPGDSHNAVIHHIATESALPLGSGDGEVPAELAELVAATLSRDPGARPASAAALAERLQPFARRQAWAPHERPTTSGAEIGFDSTLLASVSIPEPSVTPERSGTKRRDGSKRWLAALGLGAAVGLAALARSTLRPRSGASEQERSANPPERRVPAPSAAESTPRAAGTPQEIPMPSGLTLAPSHAAAVRESAAPRPPRAPERPGGQTSAIPLRARPPPRPSQDDTGASFDDRNPYR